MQKIDRKYFYASVREEGLFHKLTQAQVDSINTILSVFESEGVTVRTWAAYMLATAYHETGPAGKDTHMLPIYERGAASYFNKYDPPSKIAKSLGNTLKGDGLKYRGRGYSQTTGRRNYQIIGQKYNIDLLNEPDRMLEPLISAKSMVYMMVRGLYTGKKLGDPTEPKMSDAQQKDRFRLARYVVNGQDDASLIAGYALKFLWCLRDDVEPIIIVEPKAAPVPRNTDIATSNMDVAELIPITAETIPPVQEEVEVLIPKAEPQPESPTMTAVVPPPRPELSESFENRSLSFLEWLSKLWKLMAGKPVCI